MPAGPSWTPGALPGGLTSGLALPEDEVERVTLMGIIRVVPPFIGDGQHLLPRKTAEFPIRGPRAGIQKPAYAPVVGNPNLTQLAHRDAHLGDGLCSAPIVVRWTDVQRLHHLDEVFRPPIAQGTIVLPGPPGLAQNGVVD